MNNVLVIRNGDKSDQFGSRLSESGAQVDNCVTFEQAEQLLVAAKHGFVVIDLDHVAMPIDKMMEWVSRLDQPILVALLCSDVAKAQASDLNLPKNVVGIFGDQDQDIQRLSQLIWCVEQRIRFEVNNTQVQSQEVLATTSHDLKTPLGFISSSVELLLSEDKSLSEGAKEACHKVKKAADYCFSLTADLLEVGKLNHSDLKLDYENFYFGDLLETVKGVFEFELARKRVNLVLVRGDRPMLVKGDYGRLCQLMTNLISNAVKYSPEGTTIRVELKFEEETRLGRLNAKRLVVSVEDQGRGIPKNQLDKVFERFQQVSYEDRDKGSGLGLYICQKICTLHQGSIKAESEGDGQGSKFTVTLPIVFSEERSRKISRIMVCDDSADIRYLVGDDLQDLGFEVVEAEDGQVCLDKLKTEDVDLIFLDLNMPRLGGLETIGIMAQDEKLSRIPVVVMTNDVEPKLLKKICGVATDFIYKPAEVEQLRAVIEKIQGDSKEVVRPSDDFDEVDKKYILLVDDEPEIREMFSSVLGVEGYEVVTAKNGFEALFMYRKYLPELILCDIHMPGMNGIEFARQLVRADISVPMIFMSANLEIIPKDLMKTLPLVRTLGKPFNFDEVDRLVAEMLEAKSEAGKRLRVLVVDDSKDTSLLVKKVLGKKPVEVYETYNSRQALDLMRSNEFDLVLLDNQLGTESGLELLEKMNQLSPGRFRVAAFTSNHLAQQQMLERGCVGVITKPVKVKNLFDEILHLARPEVAS